MTLGSQEVNHDAVSFVRGAMKCCGLNKVQITTQSFLVVTIRKANEHHCQMFRLKVSPFIQLLTATLPGVAIIHLTLVSCQPSADILSLAFILSDLKVTQTLTLYYAILDP